jgi:hypothetical protein
MQDKVLLLFDEHEYFREIKPCKGRDAVMILAVHRSCGIKKPHYISLCPADR